MGSLSSACPLPSLLVAPAPPMKLVPRNTPPVSMRTLWAAMSPSTLPLARISRCPLQRTLPMICPATTTSEPTNRSQVTTQVFYFVSNYHDWLEQPDIGFTSSDHNFEGADPVNAEADDSSQLGSPNFNNANMATFPDGTSPRMQMYLFKSPFPDLNGGDDASVVYHEYTHGLSNRLVIDPGGISSLGGVQAGAMGEAWGDWYAMDYLVSRKLQKDRPDLADVIMFQYDGEGMLQHFRETLVLPHLERLRRLRPLCPWWGATYTKNEFQ